MEINIEIVNKFATAAGVPVIVCDNNSYTVRFTFDEEWEDLEYKTARFTYLQNGAVKYQDVVFKGDTVAVPVLSNTKEVLIGVFAGDLSTTTPASVPCELSIRCGTGAPVAPTSDVYDQIMEMLRSGSSETDVAAAVEAYLAKYPIKLEETDPTVSSWAKEDKPPTYTAEDVGAVPVTRKIAGNSLEADITVEEMQDKLSVYPIVELSRKPNMDTEEIELVGKVGQIGIETSQQSSVINFYRCISVTPHPQYANTFIYKWEYIGTNSNLEYFPYPYNGNCWFGKFRGNMGFYNGSKDLYIWVGDGYYKIPIETDIADELEFDDEGNLTNGDKIASIKCVHDVVDLLAEEFGNEIALKADKSYVDNLVGDVETALDNIIVIQENLIGGVTE